MHTPRELTRQLGLYSATALVVGEVIAVGIFLTPAQMSKSLGSPLWLLIVWMIMGVMALSGALCYGELAARFPEAGGSYVYLREGYGPRLAFLYGWMSFLILDPGITAALALGMASYVSYIVDLSPFRVKAVAIGTILALAAANICGLQLSAWLMRWLTVLKLGSLTFLVLWGLGLRLGDWSNYFPLVSQRPGSTPLLGAFSGGMVAAFFSFGGWWDICKLAGEIRDPSRTLPRALSFGVAIVTLVYIITNATFLYLVPMGRNTSGETFASQAGEVLFGRAGAQVFSGIVIISVLGSLAGILMTAPRVYYAMARDGLFLIAAATVHPRFSTPACAIALQASLASLLVGFGNFDQIVAYFVFVSVTFIALTVALIFVFRRRQPNGLSYQAPGYPGTPIIFLILSIILLGLLCGHNPKQALLGVGVVALGIPVYSLLFRKAPQV